MPLIGWVLAAVVATILLTLSALFWVSVVQAIRKIVRARTSAPSPEVAQLTAELHDLEAKHPPHLDGE
jgi:hypothetical protein